MFEVEIDGKARKAEVSFYTALLYEQEFHADLIQDFFGQVDDGAFITFDTSGGDDPQVVKVDFTKVNWTAIAKVLWAALKTADDSTPSFLAWMRKASGVNMMELNEQLSAEVADCFFRS